jgi:murein DD-endopeptidase MepM/ murein hydrolase activator NlpD
MANEFYTLIVVPHAKARFRRIQVPVRLAKWTLTLVGAAAVTISGVMVHYARMTAEVHDLRRLRTENSELLTKTRAYEENAGKLQAKVLQLQSMVTKLGVMAGLEHSLPEAGTAGVGGAIGMESQAPVLAPRALAAIDQSLTSLTRRSAQLEEFYRDQTLVLASTPSIWPVRGYLSAGFGNRKDPFTGQRDFHSGIDISTPIGTRIFAPADGVVLSASVQGAYGNSIIMDHGYGVVTRYGHLDAYAVRPGQRVRRGDLVGFVGNTGRSTGPHLHYEVWVRDQAQNPIHFILDEYRTFG